MRHIDDARMDMVVGSSILTREDFSRKVERMAENGVICAVAQNPLIILP